MPVSSRKNGQRSESQNKETASKTTHEGFKGPNPLIVKRFEMSNRDKELISNQCLDLEESSEFVRYEMQIKS